MSAFGVKRTSKLLRRMRLARDGLGKFAGVVAINGCASAGDRLGHPLFGPAGFHPFAVSSMETISRFDQANVIGVVFHQLLGQVSSSCFSPFQFCDFLLTDEALDFIHAAKVPVTVFVLKNVLSTYSRHRPTCDVSIPELVGPFGQFIIVCHFTPLSSFAIAAVAIVSVRARYLSECNVRFRG